MKIGESYGSIIISCKFYIYHTYVDVVFNNTIENLGICKLKHSLISSKKK